MTNQYQKLLYKPEAGILRYFFIVLTIAGIAACSDAENIESDTRREVQYNASLDTGNGDRFKVELPMREGHSFSGLEVDTSFLSEMGAKNLLGSIMYLMDTVKMETWLISTMETPHNIGSKLAYWFGEPMFSERFYVALIDDFKRKRLAIAYEDTENAGGTGLEIYRGDTLFLAVNGQPRLWTTPEELRLRTSERSEFTMDVATDRVTLTAETLDLSALTIVAPNLPRSPQGLPSNALWVDGDVVKVAP